VLKYHKSELLNADRKIWKKASAVSEPTTFDTFDKLLQVLLRFHRKTKCFCYDVLHMSPYVLCMSLYLEKCQNITAVRKIAFNIFLV